MPTKIDSLGSSQLFTVWAEFKIWLDGTKASLEFKTVISPSHYHVVTEPVGGLLLEIHIPRDGGADVLDFEASFLNVAARNPGSYVRQGAVLYGANGVALPVADGASVPANTRALLLAGEDQSGVARIPTVTQDMDGKQRLEVTGKVSTSPPPAPANTTPVTIVADNPLSLTTTNTAEYTIAADKTFVIQQVVAGAEGDSTEKGSKVEIAYFDGTTEHLVERVYVSGFTQYGVYPDTSKCRDGTVMVGNGSTKKVRLRRMRLSGAAQEVDCVVRGYEV